MNRVPSAHELGPKAYVHSPPTQGEEVRVGTTRD
jgi:hypothetical protein